MRQELAALLSSVQLLREGNPGRKIAEIQGKLATVPPQAPCLSHSEGEVIGFRQGAAPCIGVPRKIHRTSQPAGGSPCLSLWKFLVGAPVEAQNAGCVSSHGKRSCPEHWLGPT